LELDINSLFKPIKRQRRPKELLIATINKPHPLNSHHTLPTIKLALTHSTDAIPHFGHHITLTAKPSNPTDKEDKPP